MMTNEQFTDSNALCCPCCEGIEIEDGDYYYGDGFLILEQSCRDDDCLAAWSVKLRIESYELTAEPVEEIN